MSKPTQPSDPQGTTEGASEAQLLPGRWTCRVIIERYVTFPSPIDLRVACVDVQPDCSHIRWIPVPRDALVEAPRFDPSHLVCGRPVAVIRTLVRVCPTCAPG
jgi:hypothetical protein